MPHQDKSQKCYLDQGINLEWPNHISHQVYNNCSCGDSILPKMAIAENMTSTTTATKGRCQTSCPMYYAFLVFMFISIIFLFATAVPYTNIILR